MQQSPISITHISSISALGDNPQSVWESYVTGRPLFQKDENGISTSTISSEIFKRGNLRVASNPSYKNLDRSVLLALFAVQNIKNSETFPKQNCGVNIGSSRGATGLFEYYHEQFVKGEKISGYTSPTTTLGNLSSWIAQDLALDGFAMDQSVTCSTAMHAILNGVAWLQAHMADAFIVGGSEAAITPFSLAQMNALKLYSKGENAMTCESMRFEKTKNSMVLGEGAALAVLERGISKNTLATIAGYGFASEILAHNSSISNNAICFQKSMQRALDSAGIETVDALIMHAPGTVKGDQAEKNAIDIIFKNGLPLLTSNKWMIGHTFGASGMFSIEMAVLMLQHNSFIENPYYNNARHLPEKLKTVMVNAVGFGGNAVSVILTSPA